MKKLLSIFLIGLFIAACDNPSTGDNKPSDSNTIHNPDSVSAIDTSTSQDRNSDTGRGGGGQ